MARGRWLPKCPTCGNESGLRFVRSIDDKLRVYECRGAAAACRTEFVCKLWTLRGEIEEMIAELRTRIDEFRM